MTRRGSPYSTFSYGWTSNPYSGNYQLESTPERHDKSPVAVAIGKQDVREMYQEFLKWCHNCGYTERTDLVTCLAQDCYHG
ncbi:hypothetical protein EH228_10560 [Erwinia endophytica]|nr:hypothetical protein EH228_10560 [Erwinia endophytica]